MMHITGKKCDGRLLTSSMEQGTNKVGGSTSIGWKGWTKLSYAMGIGCNEESILSPGSNYTGCAFSKTC
ncbi:hypothetical protein ACHAXA_010420 [Cyclostephanos tholiformis]|uniref:Uncharacterized protein n=1 Tax=Cyclostephanos tholiformis TaxID=382380 RepID=A0ABD3SF29_9STRA